jgi:glycerol-3-phosphate dehydrogenase
LLSVDLIVIGAGINGAGIARHAAREGVTVLLIEQADLASGTTGASTRLIHGGLRYLEHGELGLVRESLHEREALLEIAPHLVEPLRLYLPVYRGASRPRWQIRIGLTLYDLLSRGKMLPSHSMLSRDAMLRRVPGLADRDLVGGASYFDAQVAFPERLVVENVQDAAAHGATVLNHAAVTAIRVADGAVRGVEWRSEDGSPGRAEAAWVVNASGPWLDRVTATVVGAPPPPSALVGGTKGSHLVVTPFPGAPDAAIYAEAAQDKRPFFIVPWNGLYLIGTTDVRFTGDPRNVMIDEQEIAYLVSETERLFPGSGGIAARVAYTQSGVRALPHSPDEIEGAITRRHVLHAHQGARGLYSIVGGKLTTYRSLAAQVLRRLRRDGLAGSTRRDAPGRAEAKAGGWHGSLPGAIAGAERDALGADLADAFGERRAARLLRTYGRIAERLLAAARARPELAQAAAPDTQLLRVELVHALESEWAVTLVDVLQRRSMLGLGADFGLAEAPAAAQALVELGLWDRAREAEELAAYRSFAAAHRARGLVR